MWTLYKKELANFFSSLIGYLSIAVFLVLTGLMLWVFKGSYNIIDFGYAGIDGLFDVAPILYMFLIPAITMRMIAEERRSGTMETLMTRPLGDWTIVWSKFLAAWTLVFISLLPTLVYYFSVYSLGYPHPGNIDTGSVIGSYIGLLLLGGAFVSIGLFCSSLTKNQIVSFIIAAVLSFVLHWGFDLLYDMSLFKTNTNLVVKSLGLNDHYYSISRGLVDTRDVVYFAGVIVVFVMATRMVLQSRLWNGWNQRKEDKRGHFSMKNIFSYLRWNRRRNLKMSHWLELAAVVIAVVAVNIVGRYAYVRFDLTAEKRYSLSDETKQFLKSIDETLLIRVYLEGDMPADYKRLHDETREILNRFRACNNNITYEFVDPNSKEFNDDERQVIYEKMNQQGVRPFQEEVEEGNSVRTFILLPGAEIRYKGRSTAIPLLKYNMQDIQLDKEVVINNSIQNLEYAFSSAIHNLSRVKKPTIAFLQGHGELSGAAIADIAHSMQDFYTLSTVTINGQIDSLTSHKFNPQDSSYRFTNRFDLLVVAKPKQPFSDQDLFIIDQYIMYGGKVLWFVDAMNAEIDSLSNQRQIIATRYPLRLDEMLFTYGVRINSDILMDMICLNIPIDKFRPWYYFPVLIPRLDHPIVNNLNPIRTEFISSIDTIHNDIKKTILLTTSEFTRVKSAPAIVDLMDALSEPQEKDYNRSLVPVAVLLEGKFHSAWRNRLAPQIYHEKAIGYREVSEPTKMVVVSDGDIIKNLFNPKDGTILPVGYDFYQRVRYANREFILNILNYMTDDVDLMTVRNKNFSIRKLNKTKAEENRTYYQIVNIVVPLLILALAGACIILTEKHIYGRKATSKNTKTKAPKTKQTKK